MTRRAKRAMMGGMAAVLLMLCLVKGLLSQSSELAAGSSVNSGIRGNSDISNDVPAIPVNEGAPDPDAVERSASPDWLDHISSDDEDNEWTWSDDDWTVEHHNAVEEVVSGSRGSRNDNIEGTQYRGRSDGPNSMIRRRLSDRCTTDDAVRLGGDKRSTCRVLSPSMIEGGVIRSMQRRRRSGRRSGCPGAMKFYGRGLRLIGVWSVHRHNYLVEGEERFSIQKNFSGRTVGESDGTIALYGMHKEDGEALSNESKRILGYYHGANDFDFVLHRVTGEGTRASSKYEQVGRWKVEVGSRTERIVNPYELVFEDVLINDFLQNGTIVDIEMPDSNSNYKKGTTELKLVSSNEEAEGRKVRIVLDPASCFIPTKAAATVPWRGVLGTWTSRIAISDQGTLTHGFVTDPAMESQFRPNRTAMSVDNASKMDGDWNHTFLEVQMTLARAPWHGSKNLLLTINALNRHVVTMSANGMNRDSACTEFSDTEEVCAAGLRVGFDTNVLSGPMESSSLESLQPGLLAAEKKMLEIINRATFIRVRSPHSVRVSPTSDSILVPQMLEIGSVLMDEDLRENPTSPPNAFRMIMEKIVLLPSIREPPPHHASAVTAQHWLWSGELSKVEPSKVEPLRGDMGAPSEDDGLPFNLMVTTYYPEWTMMPRGALVQLVEIAAEDKGGNGTWFRMRGGRIDGLTEDVRRSFAYLPAVNVVNGTWSAGTVTYKNTVESLLKYFNKVDIQSDVLTISSPEYRMTFNRIDQPLEGIWDLQPSLSVFPSAVPLKTTLEVTRSRMPCEMVDTLTSGRVCYRCSLWAPLVSYHFFLRSNHTDPSVFTIAQLVGTPDTRLGSLATAADALEDATVKELPAEFRVSGVSSSGGFLEVIRGLMLGVINNVHYVRSDDGMNKLLLRSPGATLTFVDRLEVTEKLIGDWWLDDIEEPSNGEPNQEPSNGESNQEVFSKIIPNVKLSVNYDSSWDPRATIHDGSSNITSVYRLIDLSSVMPLQSNRPEAPLGTVYPRSLKFECEDGYCAGHQYVANLNTAFAIFESKEGDKQLDFSSSGLIMRIKSMIQSKEVTLHFVRCVPSLIPSTLAKGPWIFSFVEKSDGSVVPLSRPLPGVTTEGMEFDIATERETRSIYSTMSRRLMLQLTEVSGGCPPFEEAEHLADVAVLNALVSEVWMSVEKDEFQKVDVAEFVLEVNAMNVAGVRNITMLPTPETGRPMYPALLEMFRKAQDHLPSRWSIDRQVMPSPNSIVQAQVDDLSLEFVYADSRTVAYPAPMTLVHWLGGQPRGNN